MLMCKGSVSLQWWFSQLNIYTHTCLYAFFLPFFKVPFFLSFFCWISGSLSHDEHRYNLRHIYYPQEIIFLMSKWLVLVCLYRYLCHFGKFLALTLLAIWMSIIKMHILKTALKHSAELLLLYSRALGCSGLSYISFILELIHFVHKQDISTLWCRHVMNSFSCTKKYFNFYFQFLFVFPLSV